MERSRKRKTFWYIISLFVFLLIALEITGRIYLSYFLQKSSSPKFRFNSYRIYEHVPGFKEGDSKGNWIEINNQGFRRNADVAKQKPFNTIRVFLLGASAAHGISSAAPFPIKHIYNNETIDAFLEKLLKEKFTGRNVEVINAAVTGYQFFQQTNYLMNEVVSYQPDVVIFFDGANDCYISNPAFNYYDGNRFQFWKNRLQHPTLGGAFDYTMLWCSRFSAFARGYLSWKGIKEAEQMTGELPAYVASANSVQRVKDHRSVALQTWLPVLQTNFSILKQHHIKAVFALQPMLALRNSADQSAEEKSFSFTDQNCVDVYPGVTHLLDSVCKSYQVPYLDFVPLMNGNELKGKQMFIDYCHLTPEANSFMAKNLSGFISDSLVLK